MRSRRAVAALGLVLGLLGTMLLVVGPTQTAGAASDKGRVRGNISGPHGAPGAVQVLWFTKDWSFIGKRTFRGGGYSLSLPPGTYRLQFVDKRKPYVTDKYAPTDVKVRVRPHSTAVKNVRMKRGAFITGTVRNGKGKPARNVRVVAANTAEQSFEVTADKKGRFAVAGLPQGSYSVFTYDRKHTWVAKSRWVPGLKPGHSKNVKIKMGKRAGSLTVDLYTGNGTLNGRHYITAVSKKSGQFWTARSSHGSVVFRGLYPGRYKLIVPGAGVWFGRTGAVKNGKVKPNWMAFGSFRLTKRGGWLTGTVVDSANQDITLGEATVRLYNSTGDLLDETASSADGSFTLNGQLRTQKGLRVVVQPGPHTDYLGTTSQRCQYQPTTHTGYAVATGKGSHIGKVGIDRLPEGNCNAPLPPTESPSESPSASPSESPSSPPTMLPTETAGPSESPSAPAGAR